jgi:SAM-dependent MidA family methyltransferase
MSGPGPEGGLAGRLREAIAAGGPMPFREFMRRALYEPAEGYYARGQARQGRAGDYVTSASVGAMFGRCLAAAAAARWQRMGRPDDFAIVEQGASDGRVMADLLEALPPDLAAAARPVLVEPSPGLEAAQRERLRAWPRAEWAASVESLSPFRGIHFSNELIDAFPVDRVRCVAGEWRRLDVGWSGRFVEVPGPRAEAAPPAPALEGYITEVRSGDAPWLRGVLGKLVAGWVIAFDYGLARADYYGPERPRGTLRAYRGQRPCDDPLADPGAQDLTAHVEWDGLAEAALAAGAAVEALEPQGRFLTREMAGALGREGEAWSPSMRRQFAALTHPGYFGSAFQVFAVRKGVE